MMNLCKMGPLIMQETNEMRTHFSCLGEIRATVQNYDIASDMRMASLSALYTRHTHLSPLDWRHCHATDTYSTKSGRVRFYYESIRGDRIWHNMSVI